ARRIGQPLIVGRDLLRAHHETYRRFWRWSDAVVDHGVLTGTVSTVFGWLLYVGANFNPRSLRNFPMQANGAEILRLAVCFAIEQGIEVCAVIHDAVLICAPLDRLAEDVERMRACWAKRRAWFSADLNYAPRPPWSATLIAITTRVACGCGIV